MFVNAALAMGVVKMITPVETEYAICGPMFGSHIIEHKIDIAVEDFKMRMDIFCDNYNFVEEHNKKNNTTYKLALNNFAHLTHEEFVNMYTTSARRPMMMAAKMNLRTGVASSVPASIDWVAKGAVTPVKDQGQCGSCWSFSTTGSMEGAYFNKYGSLVSFSEQELVDCSSPLNHGCNGGLPDRAFRWIQNNGGLCSEGEYPYVSGTTLKAGVCDQSCLPVTGSQVSGWSDLSATNDAMMTALATQPVSIAIEADQRSFQFYSSGVFPASECGTNLDHAVLAVGYDSNSYKVKNSWGTSWGDQGYIYLEKSASAEKNGGTCGMLMEASVVHLA